MNGTRYGGKQKPGPYPNRRYNATEYETPHAVFAKENEQFKLQCLAADVKPTRRQASKYRRKMGAAYAAKV